MLSYQENNNRINRQQHSTANPIKQTTSSTMRLEEPEEGYAMESNFFRSKSFLYIIIAALSVLSLGLFIGLLIAAGSDSDNTPPNNGPTLCDTSGCIISACNVLQGMDLQQDPCQDFYKYSCGQWNYIPDDKSVYGIADKAEDDLMASLQRYFAESLAADTNALTQTKSFYLNCTTDVRDQSSELITKLEAFGGWPLPEGHEVILTDYLSELVSFTSTDSATTVFNNGIFSVFVRKNELDKNTLYLDEPELGLDPHYLLGSDEASKDKLDNYKKFIVNAVDVFNSTWSDAEREKFAGDIVDFETNLAKGLTKIEDRRDKSWDEKSRSLAEVQGYFLNSNVKLLDIIQKLFPDETFTISEPISVLLSSGYMNTTVNSVTSASNLKNLADYIMWRYVQFQSWFVGGKLRAAHEDYQNQYHPGVVHPPQIEDICVRLTNSLLSFATARIYAQQNQAINASLAGIVAEEMRNQFLARLTDLTKTGILNQTTTDLAKAKTKAVQFLYGFPQWIYDNSALDNYYNFDKGHTLNNGLYENMATLFTLVTKTEGKILRNTFDSARWIIAPVSVKAHYDPVMNTLTLPMGVLEAPYFIPNQLPLSNFARLGVLVARELLHGFNIFGHQLNADGVLEDWWQPKDVAYFDNGVNCFQKQYNSHMFCSQAPPFCVNGNQTLDENIADNGAVLLAYEAAMAVVSNEILPGFPEMSGERLFFVQYGSMHCTSYLPTALEDQITTGLQPPEEYRVKGTLSNFPQFLKAFKCPTMSAVADATCAIW